MLEVRGQSLLEILAAVAVLALSLTAVLSLAASGAAAADERAIRLQANYLALEGVEFIRYQRDQNWAAGRPWETDLVVEGPSYGDAIAAYGQYQGRNQFFTDFAPDTHDAPAARVYQTAFSGKLRAAGDEQAAAGAPATLFTRLFTLYPVCYDGAAENEWLGVPGGGCGTGTLVGLEVESAVRFEARGRKHTVALRSRLYGWRS